MTRPSIQLILSDIDGTVLDDQHQVDSKLKDKIQQLKDKQIPFVLASARSPLGMSPIAKDLGLDSPMACYNGALILEGEQTLIEHPLETEEAAQVIEVIHQDFPEVAISLYAGCDWLCDRENDWTAHEAKITGETPQTIDLNQILATGRPIHKFLIIDTDQTIQTLYDHLKKGNFPQTAFYLSKSNYLEITHQAVSKEKALLEIAHYYDIPLENTLAIGDNFNDLPMIRLAGLGVAMANGPLAVREQADIVTRSNNQHGVSHALDHYVL